MIHARAEMRLADEYDAAQPEEVKKGGRPKTVVDGDGFTAASVGLRRDEIHEARLSRLCSAGSPNLLAAIPERRPTLFSPVGSFGVFDPVSVGSRSCFDQILRKLPANHIA